MRTAATKMLILGVAVLALLGAAVSIKNSSAKSEVDLTEVNSKVESWFSSSREVLEAAGVPHSDAEKDPSETNTAALGESVVVGGHTAGPMPWLVIVLGLAAGESMLFMAFSKQYQPASREANVKKMVSKIVAKNSKQKYQRGDDDFDDISRAVDEIVAKYKKED